VTHGDFWLLSRDVQAVTLELAQGVVPLNPQEAVFEGMLAGWARQQRSRFLREEATTGRGRRWCAGWRPTVSALCGHEEDSLAITERYRIFR